MAIAIQISVDAGATDGSTDLTQTIVVSAGSDLVMFAATGVDIDATDRNPVVSSSIDGAFTLIAEVVGVASSQNIGVFYKVNPSVGTHTMTHGTDNASSSDMIVGMAIVLTGVNQATPFDAGTVQSQGGSRTSLSLTTTTETGDLVLDFGLINGNATVTVGAAQTAAGDSPTPANIGGSGGTNYVFSTQAGADGGAMTHTWTGSQRTAHVTFNINASASQSVVPVLISQYRQRC